MNPHLDIILQALELTRGARMGSASTAFQDQCDAATEWVKSLRGETTAEGPKEKAYDVEIFPLMREVLTVCEAHDIRMFNTFKLEGALKCTSALFQPEDVDLNHFERVNKTGDIPLGIPTAFTRRQMAELGADGPLGMINASGAWLEEKLKDEGCPAELINKICYTSGQVAFHKAPWRAAILMLHKYTNGFYLEPGEALAMVLLSGEELPWQPLPKSEVAT